MKWEMEMGSGLILALWSICGGVHAHAIAYFSKRSLDPILHSRVPPGQFRSFQSPRRADNREWVHRSGPRLFENLLAPAATAQ